MSALRQVASDEVQSALRTPVDTVTLIEAAAIVEDVRLRGEPAVLEHCDRFGDLGGGDRVVFDHEALLSSMADLDSPTRSLLERAAERIRRFAEAQRSCLVDLDIEIPGGRSGHRWLPVGTAGAYAPGGRYPLPSSVLMTVIPARVAGVGKVWVASPRPTSITLAAAAVAEADGVLAVGGAQAIAALAFGVFAPPCDVVVGPGNRWVTAAKKHLFGEIGIDGLAGPSEIVVIADGTSDPHLVAADLLAQAEHDPDAVPGLITLEPGLIPLVEEILEAELASLSTAEVASSALEGGFTIVVEDVDEAVEVCDRIAPEHLALHVEAPDKIAELLSDYGSLFIGETSAEVFADYGAGPNHVLPTGGGARFQSGLSVASFLRSPTWMTIDQPELMSADAADFARLEGLEAHARAADLRSQTGKLV